ASICVPNPMTSRIVGSVGSPKVSYAISMPLTGTRRTSVSSSLVRVSVAVMCRPLPLVVVGRDRTVPSPSIPADARTTIGTSGDELDECPDRERGEHGGADVVDAVDRHARDQ